ncbi:MAG: hypothetical protein P4L84_34165 [Isosphaeraceae bacterium]|nr:hypothetical protein [Isosphaeraceae bacterium]
MRILSRSDVQRAITMVQAIEAMREAFAELATGEADVPARTAVPIAPHDAVALFMPARLSGVPALGGKIVSVHPRNRAAGLPTIHALVVLIDDATGRPIAVLEAGYLTALRTGAGVGLATDCLARPDARVLACFGAGAQAETQIEAVCAVRPIERVWVQSRSEESARRFVERMRGRAGVPESLEIARSAREALAEADVVCTATSSRTPVLDGRDLRPGTHVNAIGAFTTETREVDDETVRRARIVVDSRPACLAEAGDLVIPWNRGLIGGPETWTELGAIVLGRAPGRTSADEVTFFKSVGNAAQDLAAASVVLREAERQGLGLEISLLM